MEERFTLSSGHSAACQTRRLPPHGMWVFPPWGQEVGGGGGVRGMCVGGSSGEKKNLIRYTWGHSSGCGMWVILRCLWQRGKRDRRWTQCQGVGSCRECPGENWVLYRRCQHDLRRPAIGRTQAQRRRTGLGKGRETSTLEGSAPYSYV